MNLGDVYNLHHRKREKNKKNEKASQKSLFHFTLLRREKKFFTSLISFAIFKSLHEGMISDLVLLSNNSDVDNPTLFFSFSGMKCTLLKILILFFGLYVDVSAAF